MHTFFKSILTVLLGSVIIAQEFDPETGETIKIQYDPITGEIIKEVQYDPETGELIKSDKETVEKTVLILLKSGDSITGIIESETDTEITLLSNTLGRLMLDKVNIRSIQPFSGVSVSILPGQKSAIKSLSTAAGFTNADLNTYLIQNYGQTLDGLSHTQGTNVINKFQAGSVSKPNPETGTRGTTLSTLEIRSLALANARQKHAGPGWGLLGLAGCGTGFMGGIMGLEIAEESFQDVEFLGFLIGGALGLSLPSLFASRSAQSVPYYPNKIKTQNEKQLYKDAYVKETGLLRRRSTHTGTGVGLLGFGAFMLVLISSF